MSVHSRPWWEVEKVIRTTFSRGISEKYKIIRRVLRITCIFTIVVLNCIRLAIYTHIT